MVQYMLIGINQYCTGLITLEVQVEQYFKGLGMEDEFLSIFLLTMPLYGGEGSMQTWNESFAP